MRIVNPRCGCPIPIGRLGENEATRVVFDVSEYAAFGSGTFSLLHQRSGDQAPYPCVIRQNGSTVEWEISSADCAVEGYGKCELIFTVGSVIAKSKIYMTVTGTALTAGAEPPEPWEDWVQRVLSAGAEVESFLQTLEGGTPDQVWTKTETGAEWRTPQGGGGGGTSDHRQLTHRNDADQHPIDAVTGLRTALDSKASTEYVDREAEELQGQIDEKQDAIADLATIRSGAALGATAVRPEEGKGLFSGSYNDLTDQPTIPAAVTEYIKSASVSGNTLNLTKQDDSTISFTPQGGGGGGTSWRLLRHIVIPADAASDTTPGITWLTASGDSTKIIGYEFTTDESGNAFEVDDLNIFGNYTFSVGSEYRFFYFNKNASADVSINGYKTTTSEAVLNSVLQLNRRGDLIYPLYFYSTQYLAPPTVIAFSGNAPYVMKYSGKITMVRDTTLADNNYFIPGKEIYLYGLG